VILANLMTKKDFKKILFATLGTIAAVQLVLPSVLMAQNAQSADNLAKAFCTRLSMISSELDQRFADRQAKILARQTERLNNLAERRSDRDAKLTEKRSQWDARRNQLYAKLEVKAKTDSQKQAITAFKAAVDAAVATRKAAVDAAISSFRQGLDQAIATRKAAVDAAVNAYKSAAQTTRGQALADCSAGIAAKTIRDSYRASMKAARDKFQNDKQAIDKLGETASSLALIRQQAVEKALQDFKAALETARDNLKAAFPADSQ